jgi:hypothetical protein
MASFAVDSSVVATCNAAYASCDYSIAIHLHGIHSSPVGTTPLL